MELLDRQVFVESPDEETLIHADAEYTRPSGGAMIRLVTTHTRADTVLEVRQVAFVKIQLSRGGRAGAGPDRGEARLAVEAGDARSAREPGCAPCRVSP
jgi:hypothetical protein